ncbi:FecCD family ABC transporter permease [Polymorphum gilvum]|uniref:Transmembrane permease component of heme ABC transporter n=1 Tax=Polymorphum gilvum (strain LMG 25793 / CGMCC 1.9160 / SL003B-26A1) TaxID=991905 RepID=F2IZW8_POLGS|nr:iron ABC transporter permease [Polymorphum gilvum]ADZ70694.1 Transmembrane permease component of heme ABC transporter [Polymorphum gilvum SL003B-26A1]
MADQVLGVPAPARTVLDGDRGPRARLVIAALAVLLLAVMAFSLTTGAISLSVVDVVAGWLGLGTEAAAGPEALRDRIILGEIRLPRVVLGALVGASLAVSGAVMQGLFRNPLADPGIVGVSAGAALGAAGLIVLGGTVFSPLLAVAGIFALPLAAFLGGLATTLVLYRIGTRGGYTSIATMLLAGIALGALSGALTGLLVFVANDQQLRDLTFWGLGSLAGATWEKVLAAGPIIAVVLVVVPTMARGLNALVLGEAVAGHLGIRVQRLKGLAIVAVAAATGAGVAVSGGIGFVGIVVPHLLRLTIGPDHRYLLPACALLGASLLILADTVARTIVAPAELPIGILTAIAGAPFFLWILLKRKGLSIA